MVALWGKLKTRPVADSVVTAVVAPLKETALFRLNDSIASIRPFRRVGCDLRSGTRSPCQDPEMMVVVPSECQPSGLGSVVSFAAVFLENKYYLAKQGCNVMFAAVSVGLTKHILRVSGG